MGTELPAVWGVAGAATLAVITSGLRARATHGRHRVLWTLLALGCGLRAAGQGLDIRDELTLGLAPPLPSPAHIAFLGFVLLAMAVLLAYPLVDAGLPGIERVLDAATTAFAFVLTAWVLLIDQARAVVSDGLRLAVLIAYPLADVLILVLVIVVFIRSRTPTGILVMLALGLVALSASDGVFAYLRRSNDEATTGAVVEVLWFVGFLLITFAASRVYSKAGSHSKPLMAGDFAGDLTAISGSKRRVGWNLAPYVPVVIAIGLAILQTVRGAPLTVVELCVVGLIIALALIRQYLNVRQNAIRTRRLEAREDQLRWKAFHDGMTGLANRALFRDRLEHALELHDRDRRLMTVLFLDLDDFKLVNDTMGHARGDELLVRVSERLIGAVRTGDTVARLGGDEFAILLEDCRDALGMAAKIHGVLKVPFIVDGQKVDVGASVGMFALEADDGHLDADALLSRADKAMYAAKRAGKSRIVAYQEDRNLIALSRK